MTALRRAAPAPPEQAAISALAAVATPRPVATLAVLAALAFVVALAGLVVIPWQQTAAGKGRVVAYAPLERQQTIEAPLEGRVVAWHVREGSIVRRGDPLVDLQDLDAGLSGRLAREAEAVRARLVAAEARVAALDARSSSLEASRARAVAAASARRKMAGDRTRAAADAVRAAVAAHRTARLNLARQRELEARGLAAARARELAELDWTRAETDLGRAGAALEAAREEEAALGADAGRAATDGTAAVEDVRAGRAAALAEAASARAELARVEVRVARQAAQAVVAPRDGVVLRLAAFQGGEIVRPGEALVVLVPQTERRAVELWVSGNDAPLVTPGRHVRIQFEGWPAIQFMGWPSAAVGTFGGEVALVDATDDGRGAFRVLVVPTADEPWPEARYLRQGVRANGWILLSQVALGFELWRQFNGFPPALPAEALDGFEKGASPAKRLRK